MTYYLNKTICWSLLFSLTFIIFLDFVLTPLFGIGINYHRYSELFTISTPFIFNCLGASALAMFLAGRLKTLNKAYQQYINICAYIIFIYASALSFFILLGVRKIVFEFTIDEFFHTYTPMNSLYINFLIFSLLYLFFRVKKSQVQ